MPIEYVGGKSDTTGGSGSSVYNVTLSGLSGGISSSVAVGDMVVASYAVGALVNRSLSISDGTTEYTLIGSELNASDSFDANLRVAYKFMGDPVDSTVEFGPSGNNDDARAFAIQVFRGVDPDSPLDVAAVTATGTSSAKANPPSITPSTTGAFIICVGAAAHDTGVGQLTSSDLTDYMNEISNDVRDVSIGAGHHEWTSGAFDAAQFGFSASDSTSYSWCALSLALRPDVTTDYELSVTGGTYTLTGSDATLELAFTLDVTAGSYALVGNAVLLNFNELIILVEGGSFELNGEDALLEYGYELVLSAGGYALTGQSADLTLMVNYEINVEPGSYVLTGVGASLLYDINSTRLTIIPEDRGSRIAYTAEVESRSLNVPDTDRLTNPALTGRSATVIGGNE